MKVTIIGAGDIGRGTGTRALAGGHEVEILDRDTAEALRLAAGHLALPHVTLQQPHELGFASTTELHP